jgi:hypothetical protein
VIGSGERLRTRRAGCHRAIRAAGRGRTGGRIGGRELHLAAGAPDAVLISSVLARIVHEPVAAPMVGAAELSA